LQVGSNDAVDVGFWCSMKSENFMSRNFSRCELEFFGLERVLQILVVNKFNPLDLVTGTTL
jgi:hypothetical protein